MILRNWLTCLFSKLKSRHGRKRSNSRHVPVRRQFAALSPRTDTLESRILLTTVASLDGSNNLVLTGDAGDDDLTISATGGNVVVTANANLDDGGIAGATGGGTTTLTIPFSSFPGGSITIDTGAGDDSVDLDDVTMPTNGSLNVTSQVIMTGGNTEITTTGAGSVTLTTIRNIDLNSGTSITTVDGGITLSAHQGPLQAADFVGIDATGTMIQTTGNGDIQILGRGAETGGDSNFVYGVHLRGGSSVSSTATGATAGTITIEGTGGDGASLNYGVFLSGVGVTSVDGAISITGTGGNGSGFDNQGVHLSNIETVSSMGTGVTAGTITIEGTGGSGTLNNIGVLLIGSTTDVTSVDGAISIIGTGGNGSGSGNHGVILSNIETVSSMGTGVTAGTITIEGTGGSGTVNNFGMFLNGSTTDVTSVDGAISIIGTGGNGSGSGNYGVLLSSIETVSSTGTGVTAGTITIEGTGGSGTVSNYGVFLTGPTTDVTSVDGAISIAGTGGIGSGSNNINSHGVIVSSVVQVTSGLLTVNATAASNNSDGLQLSGSLQSIGSGSISITADGTDDDFFSFDDAVIGDGTHLGAASAATGNITINANSIDWFGSTSVESDGTLTIQPRTAGTTIGLGDSASGDLNLTSSELGSLQDGFSSISIGDATAGDIDLNGAMFADPVTLITGGRIRDNAGTDLTTPDSFTANGIVAPGQSPGILTVSGDFVFADDDTFEVEIGGTSPGTANSNHDQLDVTGTVTIGSNVTLDLVQFNSFVPAGGDSFVIVNNDSNDAVTGTFNGLAEGATISNFLGSGLDATISYAGGDGNDVVLFVAQPPVDYGDAPDTAAGTGAGNYETTLTNGGPSHTVVSGLFLGDSVDGGEDGTLQNVRANADDVNGALLDDEDGVLFPQQELLGTVGAAPTVTLLVTNNTGNQATLAGWIDYDNDGQFEASERATTSVSDGTTDGRVSLTFPVIPEGFTGTTYARFRLSTDAGFAADALSVGALSDGEVEDYTFSITSPTNGQVSSFLKIASNTNGGPSLADNDNFGNGVAAIGDLDGDGVTDIAVGARLDGSGAVHMMLMNTDGTVKSSTRIANETNGGPTLVTGDSFGNSIAAPGDIDGDGVPDLALGALSDDTGGTGRGAVYLLLMNSDGTVKSSTKIAHELNGGPTLADSDLFGTSLAGIGDIDGDGFGDLAVGAYGDDTGGSLSGAVYVLFMNQDGTVRSSTKIASDTGGGPTLAVNDLFGRGIAGLGDLDGDGVGDLAVGADRDDTGGANRGAVYVALLNADGTVKSFTKIASDTAGGPTLADGDAFGRAVASAGDLDGDSVVDLAVGAVTDDTGGDGRGAVHVLFMNSDGTVKNSTKIASDTGGGPTLADADLFGLGVASVGDLDGDGISDLAIGAYRDDTGGNARGALHLLFLGPVDTMSPSTTSFTRQTPNSSMTNADTLVFRATFNEDVQNVDAADFVVPGTTASITNVINVSASVYDITVSGGNLAALNGTVGLDLAGGQNITDLAGNALPSTEPATDETYTVQNSVEVNLSVSTNSGTEAAQTVIIITATSASAVGGDQTVTVDVTGTGITAGDYILTDDDTGTAGMQIEILDGQTSGSVTFTVQDDSDVEGDETATLTMSAPTAGLTLGTTLSQDITITDDDSHPIVASLDGSNNLLLTENGAGSNDELTIVTAGVNLLVTSSSGLLGIDSIAGATGDGTNTLTIPLSSISGTSIVINSGAGDDVVTVDVSGGLSKNIQFNGGGQSGTGDGLILIGDGVDDAADYGSAPLDMQQFVMINDGTNMRSIATQGLESVDITEFQATYTIPDPNSAIALTVSEGTDYAAGGGNQALRIEGTSNGQALVPAAFWNNQSLSVSTAPNEGIDNISLTGAANAHGNINLSILTPSGGISPEADSVSIVGDVTLPVDGTLNVESHSVTLTNATIATSGTGSVSLTSSRNIALSGGGLTTSNGGITLSANQGPALAADFIGIEANNTTIQTTGDGDIQILGRGGETGGDTDDRYGVYLHSGSSVSSTATGATAGAITIEGTGGDGTSSNFGVYLENSSTAVTSIDGAISITGNGGNGSGADNYGVFTHFMSTISSSGSGEHAATITIAGTGGDGTSSNSGVYLDDSVNGITSVDGAISITGTGGNGTDQFNTGVILADTVFSTGTGEHAATISISGTGGSGTFSNVGLNMSGSSTTVTSVDGAISITGTGGIGSTFNNIGVFLSSIDTVSSTGTGQHAATISIEGTGGSGTSENHGVFLSGSNTDVTSHDGAISVTGTGGTGTSSRGVGLVNSVVQVTTGLLAVNATASDEEDSLFLQGRLQSVGSGSINITVDGGQIDVDSNAVIGDATHVGAGTAATGNITINADSINLDGTASIESAGTLTIQPRTAGTTIGLGNSATGVLNLTSSELGSLQDRFSSISIGDETAGDIDINSATFTDPVTLITSGEIHDNDGTDLTTSDTFTADGTVAPGQSPGILAIAGDFVFADDNTFEVEIGGTSPGTANSNHDQLDVTGTVTIGSNVTLDLVQFNGFVPSGGDTFVLVNNDSNDAVTGTFNGLAEGATISNFLGSGLDATISYASGDGNDVVLTLVETTAPVLQSFVRSNPASSTTNADTLVFRATFNEDVQNVDTSDFDVTGTTASVTNVTNVSASVYDLTVSGGDLAGFNGTVGLNLSGSQNITDLVGNALPDTEPAIDETYVLDNLAATPVIGSVEGSPTNASSFAVTVVFGESVAGFDSSDLVVGGGTVSNFTGSGASYSFDVTPSGDGEVSVDIAAGAAVDGGGNDSLAADRFLIVSDRTVPTVDVVDVSADPRTTAVDGVSIVFSEAVSGFGIEDLVLTLDSGSGAGANLLTGSQTVTTSDNVTFVLGNLGAVTGAVGDYVLTLNASGSGIVDAAGNVLTADASDAWSRVNPTVTLSIDEASIAEGGGASTGQATVTATLSQTTDVPVTVLLGFTGSATNVDDYSVSSSSIVINAGSSSSSITLTAVSDGLLEGNENAFVDIIGVTNGDENATQQVSTTIVDDDVAPVFQSTATPEVPENQTAVLTVVATDADLPAQTVTYSISGGADAGAFSITSGGVLTFDSAPDFENPADNGTDNFYNVEVTADDGNGGVTTQDISVRVTDVDEVAPTVSVTAVAPDPRNSAVGSIEIVFSETVNGFDVGDLSLTRDTGSGPGANLLSGSQTLSSIDGGVTFTLGNLSSLTTADGAYVLTLAASGSGIVDAASNPLANDASDDWTMDASAPAAMISEVTPDPRNTPVPSSTIVFSEAVVGFDIGDLSLTRDTGAGPSANLLTGSQSLTTSDNVAFTLGNLASLTGPQGTYQLSLAASSSNIADAAANSLNGDAVETWVSNTTAVTVSITEVIPDPRNSSVNSIEIVFSEAVTGFGVEDLSLTLDSGSGPGGNLLIGSESLNTTDNTTFTLSGLSSLTGAEGSYTLSLTAAGSNIQDIATNDLANDASESWNVDTTAPAATISDVTPDPRNSSVASVSIVFDEAVSGFGIEDLMLTRGDGSGPGSNLLTGSETLSTSDNVTFTLTGLSALTDSEGDYQLTLTAGGSGILDAASNALAGDVSDTFTVDTTAPTATISEVTPDPRNSSVASVTIVFDEAVSGFGIENLMLTRDAGAGPGSNLLTGSESIDTTDNITFTLSGLSALTGSEGDYTLTLAASSSGITDAASNALNGNASDEWTVDTTAPSATISEVTPDPRNSAVESIDIVFDEAVSGFDIGDLSLTRDTGSAPGANLLTGSHTLSTSDNVTFTLSGLSSLTGSTGIYSLTLAASGSGIADAAANTLSGDANDSWTVNTTAPTVMISNVNPDPRNSAIATLDIVFSTSVSGFDISDLSLIRDTGSGPGSNLLTGSQSLSTSDSVTFTLGDLTLLTGEQGDYELTLTADGSNIEDALTNSLLAGANESWTLDSTAPGAVISLVTPDPRSTAVDSLSIQFNEAVTGFDISDLSLTRDTGSGPGQNLLTESQTLSTSDNVTFTLTNLVSLTSVEGVYQLTLAAAGSNILDVAANTLGADASRSWTVDTTGPTLTITPDGTVTNAVSTTFTFQFNEAVTGFDASDVGLSNGSAGAFTSVDGYTYTLVVSPVADGVVSVSVPEGAAVDAALNNSSSASVSITSDQTAPTPVITSTENNPTVNNTFEVTIDFGETVTGFDASDISAGNGTGQGAVTDNGNGSFTATITAVGDGLVTVDVASSAATDSAGNASTAAPPFSIDVQTAPAVAVRIDGPVNTVPEGGDAVFTVSLSEAADGPVTVALELVDGSATLTGDGTTGDFDPLVAPGLAGAVQFEPGKTSKTVTVSTNQDGTIEPDENFSLNIIGVNGAAVEDGGDQALAVIDGTELTIAPINDQTIAADAGTIDLRVATITTDGTPATLTTGSLPVFATFLDHGNGTGTFTFSPTAGDLGDVDLTVTATDVTGSVDATFNVDVVAAGVIETTETIRINSAGGTVAAPGGAFVSDRFFNLGHQFSTSAAVDVSDESLPAGTPASIFQTTRWDSAGGSELRYSVPVDPGEYLVRLYFAEIYGPTSRVGGRVFDVTIEGILELDDFDVFAQAGAANRGIAREFTVTSDGSLDIDFGHVVENPDVMAIEIIGTNSTANTGPQIEAVEPVSVEADGSTSATTTISVNASDANGDAITLSPSGLPDFAAFTGHGNGTGTIAVTPDAADAGEYAVTIQASLAQASSGLQPLTDSTSFALSVTAPLSVNDSPLAGEASATLTTGTPASTTPTVSITGPTDPVAEGDDAVFTVSLSNPFDQQVGVGIELVDGEATLADADFAPIVLPGSDSLNGNAELTAVVAFEPGETSKEVSIRTLLDEQTEPPETFSLNIAGAFSESGPLTVDSESATATIDGVVIPERVLSLSPISDQTIAAGTGPVDINVAASSSDGLPAMLSADGLPNFASFTDNGDGIATLVFNPTEADASSVSTLEITATDSNGSVTETFDLNVVEADVVEQATSIFRINAGGGAVAGPAGSEAGGADEGAGNRNFSADSFANTGNRFSTAAAIDLSDPSLPENTPAALFQTTRWDPPGGSELNYSIPTGPGDFEVILYFAEIYGPTSRVGARVFDVAINGQTVLENFDVFAQAGAANKGIARRFDVSTNGESLNIAFAHKVENPDIMAIDVINRSPVTNTGPLITPIPTSQTATPGQPFTIPVTATDVNSEDEITLAALGLPDFATFTDNGDGTGEINVTPTMTDQGLFPIAVQATSGAQSLTDTTAFELALTEIFDNV